MELLQNRLEFDPVLDIYRKAKPRRVLEIGCWDGGTLKEWLTNGTPEFVCAIDLEHRNREAYDVWTPDGTELVVLADDSQDGETQLCIILDKPYDWVFIDGDHGAPAVRSDVAVCLPLVRAGGHLILHDIVVGDGDLNPPGEVLNELEKDTDAYEVTRFEDYSYPQPWGHGLGVVRIK